MLCFKTPTHVLSYKLSVEEFKDAIPCFLGVQKLDTQTEGKARVVVMMEKPDDRETTRIVKSIWDLGIPFDGCLVDKVRSVSISLSSYTYEEWKTIALALPKLGDMFSEHIGKLKPINTEEFQKPDTVGELIEQVMLGQSASTTSEQSDLEGAMNILRQHTDRYYAYSDSASVYRNGEEQSRRLEKECRDKGYSSETINRAWQELNK